jgi:hypothetical protein
VSVSRRLLDGEPFYRIVIPMSIMFPESSGPWRFPPRVVGVVTGIALTVAVAAVIPGTEAAGLAWATVPVAALVGWRLTDAALGPGRIQRTFGAALAFGCLVAFGGVFLYTSVAMVAASLPGSTVSRPETPFGYAIFLALTLVTMTPFVAIPAGIIGLLWAVFVRGLSRFAKPAR